MSGRDGGPRSLPQLADYALDFEVCSLAGEELSNDLGMLCG